MTRVLVTGGTGTLGSRVASRLADAGYTVRVMSRRPKAAGAPEVEWAQADLSGGAGLSAALEGVDVIIHTASHTTNENPRLTDMLRHDPSVDVGGTALLLAQARQAGIAHLVYISIVGIERVPMSYYQHKVEAENLVRSGGVPWSILRATQFPSLIDAMLGSMGKRSLMLLPGDFRFQPVDPGEVADRLAQSVIDGPAGMLPDFGGPEIRTLSDLARDWLRARGMRRRIIPVPLPGKIASALRHGALTNPDARLGHLTWADWLQATYGYNAPDGVAAPRHSPAGTV